MIHETLCKVISGIISNEMPNSFTNASSADFTVRSSRIFSDIVSEIYKTNTEKRSLHTPTIYYSLKGVSDQTKRHNIDEHVQRSLCNVSPKEFMGLDFALVDVPGGERRRLILAGESESLKESLDTMAPEQFPDLEKLTMLRSESCLYLCRVGVPVYMKRWYSEDALSVFLERNYFSAFQPISPLSFMAAVSFTTEQKATLFTRTSDARNTTERTPIHLCGL
jgi:hypothetical protein